MKHIFSRLLIPTMVALLLLPPLSCLIFHQAARRYARDEAVRELQTLQERIVPIMEDSLSGGGEEDPIRTFVGQAGPLAAQMGGNARLMILAGEMQIIYPRDEQLRASVEPLAEEFRQYIQGNGPLRGDTDTLTAGDGEAYLVSVYEASVKSPRLRYVITYCPASRIGGWVTKASVLVLAIASVFAVLVFAVLWDAARGRRPHHPDREPAADGGGQQPAHPLSAGGWPTEHRPRPGAGDRAGGGLSGSAERSGSPAGHRPGAGPL